MRYTRNSLVRALAYLGMGVAVLTGPRSRAPDRGRRGWRVGDRRCIRPVSRDRRRRAAVRPSLGAMGSRVGGVRGWIRGRCDYGEKRKRFITCVTPRYILMSRSSNS